MDLNYIITQLYTEDEFNKIDNIFKSTTWIDNSIVTDNNEIKLSQEQLLKSNIDLDNLFLKHIENNFTFYSYCIPYYNTKILISKMETGDFFKIHNDSIMYGDFCTEISLNDTSEYEGGELSIFVENDERTFKLPKGYALTYKTGTLSKVNLVTKGERLSAKFYTKSLFKDEKIRNVYSKLLYLNTKFQYNPIVEEFQDAHSDPNYILNEIKDYFLYNHSILENKKSS